MTSFSTSWKSSKKPRKQRKYISNAPLHIKGKFLHVHLSDDLSKKFGKRSARVRKGDRVKIMKGQFKGKSGKIENVNTRAGKVLVEGAEVQKKDGTKIKYAISTSNLLITDLNSDDKRRQESLKRK